MKKFNTYRSTATYSHSSPKKEQEITHQNTAKSSSYNINHDADSITKVNTCSRSAYQRATVSVPVAVKPFSFTGPTKTSCCGEPVIEEILCKKNCNDEICYFTISQKICVEIPVHFGATAHVGDSWVECHDASTEECDECD